MHSVHISFQWHIKPRENEREFQRRSPLPFVCLHFHPSKNASLKSENGDLETDSALFDVDTTFMNEYDQKVNMIYVKSEKMRRGINISNIKKAIAVPSPSTQLSTSNSFAGPISVLKLNIVLHLTAGCQENWPRFQNASLPRWMCSLYAASIYKERII